jgi:hypothetical protein
VPKAAPRGSPDGESIEFAVEMTRQLLILSAAVLALTIALAKDISTGDQYALLAGWIAFLASILCGIWGLYALVVELDPGEQKRDEPPTLAASGVRGPTLAQMGTFLAGTGFLIYFGWTASNDRRPGKRQLVRSLECEPIGDLGSETLIAPGPARPQRSGSRPVLNGHLVARATTLRLTSGRLGCSRSGSANLPGLL